MEVPYVKKFFNSSFQIHQKDGMRDTTLSPLSCFWTDLLIINHLDELGIPNIPWREQKQVENGYNYLMWFLITSFIMPFQVIVDVMWKNAI